jgi:hypothetical protein
MFAVSGAFKYFGKALPDFLRGNFLHFVASY